MSITRSFMECLLESAKLYRFNLSIAADLSKEQLERMETALARYKVEKITEPKRLPIQRNFLYFPQLGATEICHIDIVLHYPATTPEITQDIMRATGLPESHVLVRTDSQAADALPVPQQDDTKNKTASTATANNFGTDSQVANLLKELESMAFKYASPNKEKMTTTNDLPQGTKSPMGSVSTKKDSK